MDEVDVVTCFLRNRGEVLLLRRSEDVGSYRGRWGAVAGHAEGDPDAAAREEISEETALLDAVELVRAGEPFPVEDPEAQQGGEHASRGTRWVVHAFLFDCDSRDVTTNYETTGYEWVPPTEILRRETVPDLWESYRRVRPTVETVREDRDHGSAYLSLRALEVLRDSAAERRVDEHSESTDRASGARSERSEDRGPRERRPGGAVSGEAASSEAADGASGARSEAGEDRDRSDLSALARALLAARPGMAVVRNRVNRAMTAAGDDRSSAAVERAAAAGIARALDADDRAAREAAERLSGTVLTLSRSGTALAALRTAALDAVLVAESRPGGEGVDVAETLADEISTTFVPDAGVAHALDARDVDAVVVGADTVLSDGRLVNKVGTRAAALAAAREDVPMYAVTARDKVATGAEVDLEPLDRRVVYEGDADLDVLSPTFDVTPADLVRVVTEDGVLSPDGVATVADEHRDLAGWQS